ncbi:hypothetical protein [Pantoea agglomerans]|uniref:hypothetical protein n=1 Tax=Enterobacter agglomerans TaxID=549 RepID=UPI003209ADC8
MGVEFHITRADFWAENDDEQISSDEWLDIVNNDPELSLSTQSGEFHAIWSGEGSDGEDWLDWSEGNIKTKWPPSPLYRKMLQISQKLNARVMDDDGTLYEGPDDWQYDPKTWVHTDSATSKNGSKVAAEHNAIQRFLSLFGLKKT